MYKVASASICSTRYAVLSYIVNSALQKFGSLFRSHLLTSCIFCNRQVEQEMETVIKVLQPGPLGIIEDKFYAEEIEKALREQQ